MVNNDTRIYKNQTTNGHDTNSSQSERECNHRKLFYSDTLYINDDEENLNNNFSSDSSTQEDSNESDNNMKNIDCYINVLEMASILKTVIMPTSKAMIWTIVRTVTMILPGIPVTTLPEGYLVAISQAMIQTTVKIGMETWIHLSVTRLFKHCLLTHK